MRKLIAIFCCFLFLALQYGKIVSYWQCRIQSAVRVAPCDCEKILKHPDNTKEHGNAFFNLREKTEEPYSFFEPALFRFLPAPGTIQQRPVVHCLLPRDHTRNIFQPPRL